MRIAFSIVAALSWALWLGGLAGLFIIVPALFAKSRELANAAGPVIFVAFERYQLILAALAVGATFGWRLTTPAPALTAMLALLVLAALGAGLSTFLVTAKMETLRLAGQAGSPPFMRLHGYSMMLYSVQALLLLGYGVLLPFVLGKRV